GGDLHERQEEAQRQREHEAQRGVDDGVLQRDRDDAGELLESDRRVEELLADGLPVGDEGGRAGGDDEDRVLHDPGRLCALARTHGHGGSARSEVGALAAPEGCGVQAARGGGRRVIAADPSDAGPRHSEAAACSASSALMRAASATSPNHWSTMSSYSPDSRSSVTVVSNCSSIAVLSCLTAAPMTSPVSNSSTRWRLSSASVAAKIVEMFAMTASTWPDWMPCVMRPASSNWTGVTPLSAA